MRPCAHAAGGSLATARYEELLERLERLVADKDKLKTLPERTLIMENMREHGLGELIADLPEREVPRRVRGSELDLAWWQSALEAMISGDDFLAMSDGDELRRLEAEYRIADNAHIASGAARLRWYLAKRGGRRWRTTRARPSCSRLLKDGRVTLAALTAQAPDLVPMLVPVWSVSPYLMTGLLPAEQQL